MPERTPLTDEELREDAANPHAPHGARLATELISARARIAELGQTVEGQLSEIADKCESITVLRERVREKGDRIAALADALGAKKDQHAETLRMLEHAYAVIEAAQRPPLGDVDTKPIGYVGATIGRILVTTMMSSRREDLHTDRTHYEVWRADAFTPAKPAAYAVVFDSGGDPQIDTTSLDGSRSDAERRMHSWLAGDYQAYVVELREVQP